MRERALRGAMDVRLVPGVDNEAAAQLLRAGVATVEDLRRASPDALVRAGLAADSAQRLIEAARAVRVLTDLEGLGADDARTLVEAGVADPDALARENADDLSARTGIPAASIRAWQAAAQVAPTAQPVHAALSAPQFEPAPPAKVLLKAGSASVLVDGEWRAGVPLVTAREAAGVDAALARVAGDAVALVAGSDEAVVRLGPDVFEGVPLYKERIVRAADGQGDEVEEIRVRVEEIRERGAPPPPPPAKRGLLGRLLKR